MDTPDYNRQKLSLANQIKTRLEPIGFAFLILGVGVLLGAAFAPINVDLSTTLLEISLALVSVGLGLVAIGISTKSDIRYTVILSRMDANLMKVLGHFEPSVDELEFPSDLSKNVVIRPVPASARATVAGPTVKVTPESSKAQAQARLDADTKEVGYTRGELFQKEDGSWGIRWGGKYPL